MAERVFGLLLRLYPRDFRERYGAEMRWAYREQTEDRSGQGVIAGLRLGLRTAWSMAWNAAGVWRERGGRWGGRGDGPRGRRGVRSPGRHSLLDGLVEDVGFALRGFRRQPLFAITAIGTLGLGIGGVTALWSVFYGVVLRPLPYADSDRLVRVFFNRGAFNPEMNPNFAIRGLSTLNIGLLAGADYMSFAEGSQLLEDVAASTSFSADLEGDLIGQPVQVDPSLATPNFFSFLGIPMALGRGFLPSEGEPAGGYGGGAGSVVLSHGLWLSLFDGNPDVVGRTVLFRGSEGFGGVEGMPHTIVGVASPELRFIAPNADLWVPLDAARARNRSLVVVGRLKPGVTGAQAAEELGGLVRFWNPPELRVLDSIPPPPAIVESLHDSYLAFSGRRVLLPLGAAALVLLLACANVANLLLSRLPSRRAELAMRGALGASRGRLVRQLFTEAMVLAACAAALGASLAVVGTALMARLGPRWTAALTERLGDARVGLVPLLFCAAVAAGCAVLFGLAPALRGSGSSTLRASGPGVVDVSRSSRGLGRAVLLAGQVALALVLLSSAALLMRSYSKLAAIDLGFMPGGVVIASVSLPADAYGEDPPRLSALVETLIERLEADPRIQSASTATFSGYGGGGLARGPRLRLEEEQESEVPEDLETRAVNRVTRGYFQMLGIRTVRGRTFGPEDRRGAPLVAVVSETFAERYWPGEDPIGKRYYVSAQRLVEVVGVVADARNSVFRGDIPSSYYIPLEQMAAPPTYLQILARTMEEESAPVVLREALRDLEPRAALGSVETWDQHLMRSGLHEPRFNAFLFGVFGLLGAAIAAAGVFGVLAFLVSQRTHEIGVRLALGGPPRKVVALVVRQVAGLAGAGLVIGVAATLFASRLLASLLFEVAPSDPVSIGGAATLLLTAAVAAAWLPVRRAAETDPARTLRSE